MSNSVDDILSRMIVDARNINPNLVITQGTETYIRFATAASAIWGLYKQIDWTVDQIFPSTMSKKSLEKFATERGKDVDNLTGAEILSFVLEYLRKPPSGGKDTDYERWALETTSNGSTVELEASMISQSVDIGLDAVALINPKNKDTIGFHVGSSDVNQYILVDFGSAKEIFGIGMGFTTSRGAEFRAYSSDDSTTWTLRAVINADHWFMRTFKSVSARYWKIALHSIDSLESWQIASLNDVKCHGIEFYTDEEHTERPLLAKTFKNAYGVGTMSILLAPVTLSMRTIESVRERCEEEGPVAPREIFVSVQRESTVDVRVTVDGIASLNETAFRSDVQKYFAELQAGDIFVAAQITVFAIKNGAVNATVETSVDGAAYTSDATIVAEPDQKFVIGTLDVE